MTVFELTALGAVLGQALGPGVWVLPVLFTAGLLGLLTLWLRERRWVERRLWWSSLLAQVGGVLLLLLTGAALEAHVLARGGRFDWALIAQLHLLGLLIAAPGVYAALGWRHVTRRRGLFR